MFPLNEGITLNTEILAQIQGNHLAQAKIREVQMEAAVQQLMQENAELRAIIEAQSAGESEHVHDEMGG